MVNEVAHVYLYVGQENINKILIEKGFGNYCEENYLSKVKKYYYLYVVNYKQISTIFKANAAHRKARQILARTGITDETDFDAFCPLEDAEDIEPPPKELCTETIRLSGPFSPIEINPYAVIISGSTKTVSIEPQSVNSVLLDLFTQVCLYLYSLYSNIKTFINTRKTTILRFRIHSKNILLQHRSHKVILALQS